MPEKIQTPLKILAIELAALFGLQAAGFTSPQVAATMIFLLILCGTLFYWKFRLAFAFLGISSLLALKLLDIPHVVEFAGLDIILFLVGMMAMIGLLEENHFFEHLVNQVLTAVGPRPYLLMAVLMSFSTFSAALVDEVTSILFMMSTMLHIVKKYKLNPVPFVIMIVFATNIGSSATAVGNPIGVMIALRAGLTFGDFLRWATPISVACLTITIPLCFLLFRKDLQVLKNNMRSNSIGAIGEGSHAAKDLWICWAVLIGTITCLVSHHHLEEIFHLEKNTLLIATALAAGAVSIFLKADDAREFFMRRVDWWTLTFFLALFASVGTLKYVGVTEHIARGMISLSGGGSMPILLIFTSAISLLTALMDNVLAVATFIPILKDIENAGIYTFPFWWAMLFGGTLYGNATIIGSTANIVAMGMLEKSHSKGIKFMEWLKPGLVVSTATITLAICLLMMQFHLMPNAPARF